MFITSSRKPSLKTRTFCKRLSQFTTFKNVNRGKTGLRELLDLSEGEPFLIVGEYHGNPGSLSFHGPEGNLLFSLRFSDASPSKPAPSTYYRKVPWLCGNGEVAEALASFLPFKREEQPSFLPEDAHVLVVDDQILEFMKGETSVLKLKLRGFKRYDEAGPETEPEL